MSDLKDLLHGAGEAKRQLFASEDFAVGYGRSVVSRVKRRRAVTATAMGGGTVVAAGALAFGASNVPWGSFVMGAAPVGRVSVLCTTATAEPVPEFAPVIFTFTDPKDGSTMTVTARVEASVVVEPDGGSLVSIDDGDYRLTFPNGTEATVGFPIAAVGLPEGGDQNSLLGAAIFDGDVTVTSERGPIPTPSPAVAVTCASTSPQPSASATPSVRPSVDRSVAATPSPTPTVVVASGDTPFQCGYVFASDEFGTDALRVFGAPTTDSAIRKVFKQWYGDQAPTTEVGDTQALAFHAGLGSSDVIGATSSRDPASHESIQASQAYDVPSLGLTFVAVRNGVVVGTVVPGSDGQTPGVVVDRDGEANPEEAFMWDLDALTPCGTTSIEATQIYAVAGFGRDGDFAYSWIYVSE